jgi:hypothetical protein
MWWSRRSASLPVLVLAWLTLSAAITGCSGGHHLQPTTPVPGSRSTEGRTIEPLDSAHTREIRPLHPGDHTIIPLDSGRTIVPLDSAHTVRPLGTTTPTREIAPLSTEVVPVDGTRWTGSDHEGPLTLEFLVGGILRYTKPSGTYTNGTWEQHSNTITFETNSHYADWTGEIRGRRMTGTGHNRQGARWDWRAERE